MRWRLHGGLLFGHEDEFFVNVEGEVAVFVEGSLVVGLVSAVEDVSPAVDAIREEDVLPADLRLSDPFAGVGVEEDEGRVSHDSPGGERDQSAKCRSRRSWSSLQAMHIVVTGRALRRL